jgi:AraC-like DNA-binding protein
MIDMIIVFLIFFGGAMSWTMSLGQLMDRNKSTLNYMLAAFLFCAGVCQMYNGLKVSGLLIQHPHFAFVYVPFLYFTGPAFFFCFKSLTGTHYRLQLKDALHLVPLLIILISLIPFYAMDSETKRAILMSPPFFQDSNPMMSYYTVIVFIVVVGVLAYLAIFIKNSGFLWNVRYLKMKKISVLYVVIMSLSYSMAIIYFIGLLTYNFFFTSHWFYLLVIKTMSVISFLVVFLIYLVSRRDPNFFQFMQQQVEKIRYERSKINKLDLEDVLKRMDYLMKEEKIFFDEDLNLNKLSHELAIEPYQLSQILNEKLKKNFNMYINEFRIEEAKKLLVDEPERSIVSVSYAVGFNSPTSFYDWFFKMTGLSPSKYRKKQSGKHSD